MPETVRTEEQLDPIDRLKALVEELERAPLVLKPKIGAAAIKQALLVLDRHRQRLDALSDVIAVDQPRRLRNGK